MDIVDLGLMYDVELEERKGPRSCTALTSMGCPVGADDPAAGSTRWCGALPGVDDVEVELTWDPPWTPEKMSEDAKFILGFG